MERFKELGFSNVHLEPWTIANSWARGPATGRIISPAQSALTLAAAGWSPSSNGPVHGVVVGLSYEKLEDLEKYRGKLEGAIILLGQPREMESPGNPMTTAWSDETLPVAHPKGEAPYVSVGYRKVRRALPKRSPTATRAALWIGADNHQ